MHDAERAAEASERLPGRRVEIIGMQELESAGTADEMPYSTVYAEKATVYNRG